MELAIHLFFVSLYVQSITTASHLVRQTSSGPATGFIDQAAPNVAQFLGIPFAEPPIGTRRWLPPVLKRKEKSLNATAFGKSCSQFLASTPTIYTEDVTEFNVPVESVTGEDCLSVSIWAPKKTCNENGSLPVIAWLYGGGFYTGGANVPYQNPTQWIERSQKHIVVSINYRLNIFGFPNAAGLKSTEQNLGFLDQRLGLEWIRSNIASFGGDPKRITLWGQSAGAISADFYNFAYPKDPIVHGYILHSGTAQIALARDASDHSNFTYVASHLGCGNLTAQAELDCMRKVSDKEIIAFIEDQSNNSTMPPLAFTYVVDKRTVFPNFTKRALAGEFSKKPALIGTTTDEGVAFSAYNRSNGPNITEAEFYTLGIFLCPTVQTTQDRYTAGASTFRYLYGGNFSNISPQWWEGAYHSSDLPLVFGTSGIGRGASTSFEIEVSKKMQDYWLAFAEDPVNGLLKLGWEKYEPEGNAVLLAWEDEVNQPITEKKLEGACDGLMPKPGATPPP